MTNNQGFHKGETIYYDLNDKVEKWGFDLAPEMNNDLSITGQERVFVQFQINFMPQTTSIFPARQLHNCSH